MQNSPEALAMLKQLTPIFQDVMDDDDLVISADTKAEDVDNWDSLAQIRLVVSIEEELGLKFTASEISSLQNVGDLLELIARKRDN